MFVMDKHNFLHSLPVGPKPPREVFCVVEIPTGCTNKYEYDQEHGVFKLDRVLYEAVFYPTEYGFIPQTWDPDNDPLDIMVDITFPTFPGCVIAVRPVAVLKLIDTGKEDNKIIAVAADDPRFENTKDFSDLDTHFKKEVENFWGNYAELQPDKKIKVVGWGKEKVAYEIIEKAAKTYQEKYGEPGSKS